MRNYYICTIDRIPCVFDGDQFVFARDGVALSDMSYPDLKSLRKEINQSERWRRAQGFGTRDKIGYLRIRLPEYER